MDLVHLPAGTLVVHRTGPCCLQLSAVQVAYSLRLREEERERERDSYDEANDKRACSRQTSTRRALRKSKVLAHKISRAEPLRARDKGLSTVEALPDRHCLEAGRFGQPQTGRFRDSVAPAPAQGPLCRPDLARDGPWPSPDFASGCALVMRNAAGPGHP